MKGPPPSPTPARRTSMTMQQHQRQSSAPLTGMVKSMTIDEMRALHRKALHDAEAKRTELRLVLASRYRELVGSSEEVTRMRERSNELHQLVHALPLLLEKVTQNNNNTRTKLLEQQQKEEEELSSTTLLKSELIRLPRLIYRALDEEDVHGTATYLMKLLELIASHDDDSVDFSMATALTLSASDKEKKTTEKKKKFSDLLPQLQIQISMTYRQIQSLPQRTLRMAKKQLLLAAEEDTSACALATIVLLQRSNNVDLLDLYFDSKAKLLQSLLNQLTTTQQQEQHQALSSSSKVSGNKTNKQKQQQQPVKTETAESILCQIVAILQKDIILHPYQMFCANNDNNNNNETILPTPIMERDLVKMKVSHFLAAHLPLIRTKVKSVLIAIAGTTAQNLGQIRQSLYDKTSSLDSSQQWIEGVRNVVDVKIVLQQQSHHHQSLAADTTTAAASSFLSQEQRKFSLWSALFSNTFSNLVHSLLTSSFHSVHSRVVSTLRTSLANAPPFCHMRPHEAYRNTLQIATNLDAALKKVSDDAHELLVHAEERAESERRLRQSLYVQTCEIMGRLVCELRRMLQPKQHQQTTNTSKEETTTSTTTNQEDDATKEYLVGRLCHLLQFRLTSLPTLLDPQHSPAKNTSLVGNMITLVELSSAFDLADDNEDGLITFEEAMEAVDSAFSGTSFRGAGMIHETLLLEATTTAASSSTTDQKDGTVTTTTTPSNALLNCDVTLRELTLLSARGLRHSASQSALGTIQSSLNDIIEACFFKWAKATISSQTLKKGFQQYLAVTSDEAEWQRIYSPIHTSMAAMPDFATYLESNKSDDNPPTEEPPSPRIGSVSPHVAGYLLSVSSTLNRSVCPADNLESNCRDTVSTNTKNTDSEMVSLTTIIRISLLQQALYSVSQFLPSCLQPYLEGNTTMSNTNFHCCASALIQCKLDCSYLELCLLERNKYGFQWRTDDDNNEDGDNEMNGIVTTDTRKKFDEAGCCTVLTKLRNELDHAIQQVWVSSTLQTTIRERHHQSWEASELYLTSLLGTESFPIEEYNSTTTSAAVLSSTTSNSSWQTPLPSSRRFLLLSIPTDRSLSELQRRKIHNSNAKSREDKEKPRSGGFGGLGFFSSMLQQKK